MSARRAGRQRKAARNLAHRDAKLLQLMRDMFKLAARREVDPGADLNELRATLGLLCAMADAGAREVMAPYGGSRSPCSGWWRP